jgi:hypothetical protein
LVQQTFSARAIELEQPITMDKMKKVVLDYDGSKAAGPID